MVGAESQRRMEVYASSPPTQSSSQVGGFSQVTWARCGDILGCHDGGVLLASSGPGVLLNILQPDSTGEPSTTKNDLAPNINSAQVEKLGLEPTLTRMMRLLAVGAHRPRG